MPVADWDTTADRNTSIAGVDIGEHCASRNVNDAIRAVMAEAKARFNTDSFTGEIRLFYGTIDVNGHPIPLDLARQGVTVGLPNWHVCDGASGTPDMRGRVAVGVSTSATLGTTSGSDSVTPSVSITAATQAVSIGATTLSVNQIPSHTHTYRKAFFSSGTITETVIDLVSKTTTNNAPTTGATGGGQSHSHTITSSSHTHTLTVGTQDNRQSGRALYYIMRIS